MACVVPDHDMGPFLALLQHPHGQRGGHHPYQHPVHPEGPGPHPAPHAGGPEGEPALEAVLETDRVAGQQGFQLRAGVGVGVGRQPLGGPLACARRQRSAAAAVDSNACSKVSSAFTMCWRISSLAHSALPEATAS